MSHGRALVTGSLLVVACGSSGVRHIPDAPPGSGSDAAGHNDAPVNLSTPGIYVTNASNTISIFDIAATGDAAPVRAITGSATGLSLPIGVQVDHLNNIYVANRVGSTITVYTSDANGDAAPIRTLMATGMGAPEGLALGPSEDVYTSTCPSCGESGGGMVGVFHFAVGATTSDFSIAGDASFSDPDGLAIDDDNNIIVGNAFGGVVATFAAGATGSAAPTRTFTPPGTNLQDIAVGGNAIAVTTPGDGVDIYALTASGSATPVVTLSSTDFPLSYPGGVFIDRAVSPEVIYVVDYGGNAIYALTTAGTEPNLSIASVRVISGADTTLAGPLHISVVD
jgi:hypothetical protein